MPSDFNTLVWVSPGISTYLTHGWVCWGSLVSLWSLVSSGWREAKKSNREEKEKFEINFSSFERRKRNLILISPTSRGEREIWNWFLQFREEKEKYEFPFLSFEKRKRNQKKYSQLSRRERERYILCSSFEKRKRNLTKYTAIYESRKRNYKCFTPILRGGREYWNSFLQFWE